MNKEDIKNLLYDVRNEFENEVDDIDMVFDDEITDREVDLMFKFLDMFINKMNLLIDESEED